MHNKLALFFITLIFLLGFSFQAIAQDVIDEADLVISGGDEVPADGNSEGPISVFSVWDLMKRVFLFWADGFLRFFLHCLHTRLLP